MKRADEEILVKKLNLTASKLLECYQWNHLDVDYQKVKEKLIQLQTILAKLQGILLKATEMNNHEDN